MSKKEFEEIEKQFKEDKDEIRILEIRSKEKEAERSKKIENLQDKNIIKVFVLAFLMWKFDVQKSKSQFSKRNPFGVAKGKLKLLYK